MFIESAKNSEFHCNNEIEICIVNLLSGFYQSFSLVSVLNFSFLKVPKTGPECNRI